MSRALRQADRAALSARTMLRDDIVAVERIERDIYAFPWSEGNFADSLAAGYDAWLFESANQLAGYAVLMWAPDEVHLLNLSVARAAQRQGFGRTMLRWILDNVAQRGARRLMLEVRMSNQVARHVYASVGFEPIGVRKRYYPAAGGTREDALVLLKKLADE